MIRLAYHHVINRSPKQDRNHTIIIKEYVLVVIKLLQFRLKLQSDRSSIHFQFLFLFCYLCTFSLFSLNKTFITNRMYLESVLPSYWCDWWFNYINLLWYFFSNGNMFKIHCMIHLVLNALNKNENIHALMIFVVRLIL